MITEFLESLTPSGRRAIVTIDNGYVTHKWYNTPQEAQDILALIREEMPTYFSLAAFSSDSRKADNAVAAKAFWLDLDCGAEKQEKHGSSKREE